MTSAGNDIVSLTAKNITRAKGPEFYSKIISGPERELFDTLESGALLFGHFVWLLWSVKESAFKYLHRVDPSLIFTPVKFVVSKLKIPSDYQITNFGAKVLTCSGFNDLTVWDSSVCWGNNTLFAKTLVFNEFITSVVNDDENFNGICFGIKEIENSDNKFQSAAVREFAIEHLQEALKVNNLVIGKNADEVPVLLNNGEAMSVAVSLSHHERWVAYSFRYQR